MKINVTENKISIKEEQILNENEYNIHKIQFDFSSEYTDDLIKVALFSIDNHTYKKIISNNECDIPPEVLTQRGYSILGVYAYKTEQDTLVLRYSPSPTRISVYDGSYKADAENSEPITPSEIEQYQQILQNSLQQFQNQYNALVEETEGDIQAIEDELQRKVDEGYFDGEDGFSPIAKVIQKSNGATIEIEDKNGKTTADVLNGEDGYTPVRGIDYWTEEDKQEVEEEATQQIEGKIEEYNENAAEKLNQYNQNSVQKTNDYNTNAEQKMSAYNTNATEKLSTYNSNATEKFNNYNSNAEQKETNYNTNASSKLSEYNSNAETKKSAYDENATQKTNSFNTNATNKLTEYNTNHTEKMSAYNSNSTEKLNSFNENATQKTEDFDEHTEEIQDKYNRLKATLPTTGEVTGQDITLNKTAELDFIKPPLPMGNSEQVQYSGKNKLDNNIVYSKSNSCILETIPTGYRAIDINGTVSYPNATVVILDLRNYIGATVRLKSTITPSSTNTGKYALCLCDSNGRNEIYKTGTYTSDELISFNVPELNETSYYLGIILNANNNGTRAANNYVDYTNLILTIDNSDMSYEPYVGGTASPNPDYPQEITNVTGDVEVVVENKNIINITNEVNVTNQGVVITGDEEKQVIKFKGTISNTYCQSNILHLKKPISTGIFRANFKSTCDAFIVLVGKNTTWLKNMQSSASSNIVVDISTLPEPVIALKFGIEHFTSGANVDYEVGYQLTKGSELSSYVSHQHQTFTFPLGNEKLMLGDYLADDGIHHVRGQYIMTGQENNWFEYTQSGEYSDNLKCYSGLYNELNNSLRKMKSSICSHFRNPGKWVIVPSVAEFGAYQDNPNTNNRYFITNISTIDNWKNWLAQQYQNGTPVIIEYELAEEVIIPYTSAQQEVYNQIKQALSYEEQTNISGTSDGSNPLFSVEAYLDSKVILAEKVDKETGKGLSSNDFTNTYKSNVDSNTSARHTHTNKVVLDGIASSDITNWNGKQNETDNSLNTTNKTITGAINEVNSIAKLANQAKSFSTYQAFINYLNTAEKTEFIPGQSFMIQTKLVPDLWVYSVENTSVQYTYTTDEDFITYTNQATGGQVGYYKLAQLETQKVDLTNYVTFDDYATSTTAGVVKTNSMYGVSTSSYTQNITATTKTYDQYQSSNNATFVGKGTLENVITGKNLESANNKTTTISSSSTDNEYPSAKAVYDYIQSILNN